MGDLKDKYFWAVHGGSDTWFAAKSKSDADELVSMFNGIAREYGNPESSRVDIVLDVDYLFYREELSKRELIGDADYLSP